VLQALNRQQHVNIPVTQAPVISMPLVLLQIFRYSNSGSLAISRRTDPLVMKQSDNSRPSSCVRLRAIALADASVTPCAPEMHRSVRPVIVVRRNTSFA
jgi:hypothetical protein